MSDRIVYLALMAVGAVGVVVGLVIQRCEDRPPAFLDYGDDLGADPGKPEHGAPMWMFWLMVTPLIVLGALVIASQVWR